MAGGTLDDSLRLATTNIGIVIICYWLFCNNFNDALTYLLFSFKSCEPCCFIHHFVDVARKLSRFCKMARR